LILIDNGSDVETRLFLENLKKKKDIEIVLIRNEENAGFVKAVNQGFAVSREPYVCVLNNDTMPGPGWLGEIISFAQELPDVGLLNPICNGHMEGGLTVEEYADKLSGSNKGKYMEMNQCQGFCMVIKRELIDKIGQLDENFGVGGFDDTDYSMRAHKAGYRSVCVYSSYVYHREHESFRKLGDRKKIQSASEGAYFKKWPRHKRIALVFSMSKHTGDKEIENCLNTALYLAREWCWVNLLVFGKKDARERMALAKKKIDFPLHQNIKLNYLNRRFRMPEIAVRILERSFGSKRRKKYDVIIYNEVRLGFILKILCTLHNCERAMMSFNSFSPNSLRRLCPNASTNPNSYANSGSSSNANDANPNPTGDRSSPEATLSREGPVPIERDSWCPAEGRTSEAGKSRGDFSTVAKNPRPLKRSSREGAGLLDKCDIIMPVCGQYEFTKKCVENIIRHTDTPYRLIVLNNGQDKETKEFLRRLDRRSNIETIVVNNDENLGWGRALNQGIGLSEAPFICFQNNDTVVTRGWLKKMISILRLRRDFGLINPSWEGKPAGISIEEYNSNLEKKKGRYVETDWCRGFSMVAKRSVIDKIGGIDEAFGLAYFDDVDYSIRAIEAGFLCLRALDTYVHHERNVTAFEILRDEKWNELHERNKLICYKKWGRPLRIGIVLDKRACRDYTALNRIEKSVFYLARKQHRLDIWGPRKLEPVFRHTNVRLKACHPLFLRFFSSLDFYVNRKRKPEKRYNAVFRCTGERSMTNRMIEIVDRMKKNTKDKINVKL